MKLLTAILLCMILIGCDYEVALQSTPSNGLDSRVLGQWERVDAGGQAERLLVLPLNTSEYLISFPKDSPDAMFARAWSCTVNGKTLIQLRWFGTAKGVMPENDRVFQVASYDVNGQTLRVSLLNADLVSRDVKTSEDLARDVANNLSRSDVFREAMEFARVPTEE